MISGHHLNAATRYRGGQVVGLVDRDLSRARAQAQRFGIERSFDNLPALLALQPDVIHVLTPPAQHLEVVLQALAGGAHRCTSRNQHGARVPWPVTARS